MVMNSGINCLGQGNRANATIGRALQLIIRNVGGGRPGELDRAVLGEPGKYTFCFAEDEDDPRWESYAVSLGYSSKASTVTVFPGDGITQIIDHISRRPEDLCRSYAGCIRTIYGTGHIIGVQAFLAIAREHAIVFYDAGKFPFATRGDPPAPSFAADRATTGRRSATCKRSECHDDQIHLEGIAPVPPVHPEQHR